MISDHAESEFKRVYAEPHQVDRSASIPFCVQEILFVFVMSVTSSRTCLCQPSTRHADAGAKCRYLHSIGSRLGPDLQTSSLSLYSLYICFPLFLPLSFILSFSNLPDSIHVHIKPLPVQQIEFIVRNQLPTTVFSWASSAPVFQLAAHCYRRALRASESTTIVLTVHYSGHCDAPWMLTHSLGTTSINLLSASRLGGDGPVT